MSSELVYVIMDGHKWLDACTHQWGGCNGFVYDRCHEFGLDCGLLLQAKLWFVEALWDWIWLPLFVDYLIMI